MHDYRHCSLAVNATKMERVERAAFEFDGNNQGSDIDYSLLIIDLLLIIDNQKLRNRRNQGDSNCRW